MINIPSLYSQSVNSGIIIEKDENYMNINEKKIINKIPNNIKSMVYRTTIFSSKKNYFPLCEIEKYFCKECNSIPVISLKNEKNNIYYDIYVNCYCDNGHQQKIKLNEFLKKNTKKEFISKNDSNNDNFITKIKEKINSFTNNMNFLQEIIRKSENSKNESIIKENIDEIKHLFKYYKELNELEKNLTSLLLNTYQIKNLDLKNKRNIHQVLNFNENYIDLNLNETQIFSLLLSYLKNPQNFCLKANENIYEQMEIKYHNKDLFMNEIKSLDKYKLKARIKQDINTIILFNEDIIILSTMNKSIVFYNLEENKIIEKILEIKQINDVIKLNDNLIIYNIENIIKICKISISPFSYQTIQNLYSHNLKINKIINFFNGFITCSEDGYFKIFERVNYEFEEIKNIKAHDNGITSILLAKDNKIVTVSHKDKKIKLFQSNNLLNFIDDIICKNNKNCLFNILQNSILLYGIYNLFLINLNNFIIQEKIDVLICSVNVSSNSILAGDKFGEIIQYIIINENDNRINLKNVIPFHNCEINYITQFDDYIISSSIDGDVQILKYQ